VDGRADVEELARALDAEFPQTGQYHTAAGLVLKSVGRLTNEGEVFQIGGFQVEVIDMDDRRIDKLLFRRKGSANPPLAELLSA
jgi:putative hemolysin